MKLKELKDLLNSLPSSQLEEDMLYNSPSLSISGVIKKAYISKEDLYYTGEDDPAKLYTKKELKKRGMDNEEIQDLDIEIHKGSFVVEF